MNQFLHQLVGHKKNKLHWRSSLVKQTIKEKIRQRRTQMLVHSYIYYEKDDNIVSDFKWQEWADELRDLQNNHPDECNIGFYDKEFEGYKNLKTEIHKYANDCFDKLLGEYEKNK